MIYSRYVMKANLHHNRFLRNAGATILILVIALSLTACGTGEEIPEDSTVNALPATWTPTPYVSPTPIPPTSTPTAIPTDTATPAPTATPPANAVVLVEKAALRDGPGLEYAQVGGVNQGDMFLILARDSAGEWWQIRVNLGSERIFYERR